MRFSNKNTKIILPLTLLLIASAAGSAVAEDKPEAETAIKAASFSGDDDSFIYGGVSASLSF